MLPDRKAVQLLNRHRCEAVLLHRPYPPHSGPRTNSKFGGLPRLPVQYNWPRTPGGVPLHFLAQIDCADVPFRTTLPERGVLFFFGRDDDDQIWENGQSPHEACRVIYALDAFGSTPKRAVPTDLPPIGGDCPRPNDRPFLREDECGPNVHVEWPIQALRFDSWPDASALSDHDLSPALDFHRFNPARLFVSKRKASIDRQEERQRIRERYYDMLDIKRAEAYFAATGLARGAQEQNWFLYRRGLALRLYRQDTQTDAFPQMWISVAFFCRAMRASLLKGYSRLSKGHSRDHLDLPQTADMAEKWIVRADLHASTERLSATERNEFRSWIESLKVPESPVPLHPALSDFIVDASVATVRSLAGDPNQAGLVSNDTYAELAPFFQGRPAFDLQFSQMLGHAPSAQEARSTDDPTICLLNLSSDLGLGWLFGDVGECTFWITPTDLLRCDFERVRGTIEGH